MFLADGDIKECDNFETLRDTEIPYDLNPHSMIQVNDSEEWVPLWKFVKPTGRKDPQNVKILRCPKFPRSTVDSAEVEVGGEISKADQITVSHRPEK